MLKLTGISLRALGNSYTDILAQSGFDVSKLANGSVSISYNIYSTGATGAYNDPIVDGNANADTKTNWKGSGKINVTAQWNSSADGDGPNTTFFSTVENVQSGLGDHELLDHGINGLHNEQHKQIFFHQMTSKFFKNTTPKFKRYINESYRNTL